VYGNHRSAVTGAEVSVTDGVPDQGRILRDNRFTEIVLRQKSSMSIAVISSGNKAADLLQIKDSRDDPGEYESIGDLDSLLGSNRGHNLISTLNPDKKESWEMT
jgi:hypothetical protein